MKAKTIKAVIAKKMVEWWKTIEDNDLRERVSLGTIVTGGCIASMLLREEVKDFDVYLRDHQTALDLAKYYVARFEIKNKEGVKADIAVHDKNGRVKIIIKSSGIASEQGTAAAGYVSDVMQDPGDIQDAYEETEKAALERPAESGKPYRPVFMSTNAITLANKLQIVLRFYGEPEEIHKNYDFVHCTNYWTSWDRSLTLHQPALESLLAKELRYVGSKYPICSVFRLRKFINRGWQINAGQILKMCLQISELDLNDISVLEDQLVGVDVAYFVQVVEALKQKDTEKVNSAYLVEILDRMF